MFEQLDRYFDVCYASHACHWLHVLGCGTFDACFCLYPSNWLSACKLEVWEWVVKRCIFDPFSEFSGWILVPPDISMNLDIRPFRVG